INYQLSTVNCPLSTINCQLSIVHYQLSTIHYPPSTIHYPLSTIHYQPLHLHIDSEDEHPVSSSEYAGIPPVEPGSSVNLIAQIFPIHTCRHFDCLTNREIVIYVCVKCHR